MTTLDSALTLCAQFPVFPVLANKKPATPHGFKDAVQSPTDVVDLWRRNPGPLIGVPTGIVSGIDALDIDPKNGGDAWLAQVDHLLPNTRRSVTRSGGVHLFFAHLDGVKNTAGKIARGVDTRGDGGYVVWWSAHGCPVENPELFHAWPRWLLDILLPPKPQRARPPAPATAVEGNARAALMIERAKERVRLAQPGQRHVSLRAAAATLGGLVRFLPGGEQSIRDELVQLAMDAGGEDRASAEKTAEWAMGKGKGSPLLTAR